MIKLLQSYWNIGGIYGLEVNWQHGQLTYYLLKLIRKGSKATIESSSTFSTQEELFKAIDKNIPIALVFNGRGVLLKVVNQTETGWEALLQQALPSVTAEDFITQLFQAENEQQLAILRKESALEVMDQIQQAGYYITHIGISLQIASVILPLLNENQSAFAIHQQIVGIEPGHLLSLRSDGATQTISIGDQQVHSNYVLSFAIALQALLGINSTIYNLQEASTFKANYLLKKRAYFLSGIVLVLLFILLLANFLLFSYLGPKTNERSIQLSNHQQQLEQITTLEQELQQKQKLAGNNSVLSSSKVSFYADDIARTLPSGIQLLDLNIFPKLETSNREENYQFDKKVIRIKGQTRNSAKLNLWIKQLESLDWVKQVKVLPYKEDKQGLGTFELVLLLS